ncbi:MAG: hypothetical protein VX683_02265 [Cyanobacteriota bacterium]|nr:hypothetical protein [Cyanobacteriota bacterium]
MLECWKALVLGLLAEAALACQESLMLVCWKALVLGLLVEQVLFSEG